MGSTVKRSLWLTFVALIVFTSPLASQTVTREYDKFKNQTTVTLELVHGDIFDLTVLTQCDGNDLCAPEKALLMFSTSNESWRYMRSRNLILIVDGEQPVNLGEAVHDGRVGSGYVLEFLLKEIPFPLLRRLARARSVEYQLGISETQLSEKQLNGIRELVETFELANEPES